MYRVIIHLSESLINKTYFILINLKMKLLSVFLSLKLIKTRIYVSKINCFYNFTLKILQRCQCNKQKDLKVRMG